MKRDIKIDNVKGTAIILVVFAHICTQSLAVKWVYSFHMPLFFIIGGILYKRRDIITDIKNRFLNIMIPFYIWGGVTATYGLLVERRYRSVSYSLLDCVKGLVLGKYDYLGFNPVLWFFPVYFFTTILYNILIISVGEFTTYLISIICFGTFFFIRLPDLPMGVEKILLYLVFMTIGDLLKKTGLVESVESQKIGINILNYILF